MHKNLSGKTDYVAHTRNAAKGKRGVNKAERQMPVPDQDEPAYKHRKKPKRKSNARYDIEQFCEPESLMVQYGFAKPGWNPWVTFTKKEDRDHELAKVLRTYLGHTKAGAPKYRAVDREEKE